MTRCPPARRSRPPVSDLCTENEPELRSALCRLRWKLLENCCFWESAGGDDGIEGVGIKTLGRNSRWTAGACCCECRAEAAGSSLPFLLLLANPTKPPSTILSQTRHSHVPPRQTSKSPRPSANPVNHPFFSKRRNPNPPERPTRPSGTRTTTEYENLRTTPNRTAKYQ